MDIQKDVAKALIKIGGVGFVPKDPITFKSGIVSPIYVDNRKFPFYPDQWRTIIQGFKNLISEKNIKFDVIAGIETAGIPHSAALGYATNMPSVFVRKQVKDHGTKKRVEGGDVTGKRVLLIEDLVSTGSSSLSGVEALRDEGAIVEDCLVIVSYEFKESVENFAKSKVNLHALTNFEVILEEAFKENKFTQEEYDLLKDWFSEPWGWAKKHGLAN